MAKSNICYIFTSVCRWEEKGYLADPARTAGSCTSMSRRRSSQTGTRSACNRMGIKKTSHQSFTIERWHSHSHSQEHHRTAFQRWWKMSQQRKENVTTKRRVQQLTLGFRHSCPTETQDTVWHIAWRVPCKSNVRRMCCVVFVVRTIHSAAQARNHSAPKGSVPSSQ